MNFNGLDDPQKVHGLASQIAWFNEAMEFNSDDFDQVEQRNTEFIIMDWNPSKPNHFIFEQILKREDVFYFHSTIFDNPFATDKQYKKVLGYRPCPENFASGTANERMWKIYGLGLRFQDSGLCIKDVEFVDKYPENCSKESVGLDFGYTNDPTACERTGELAGYLYIDELFYEYGLSNNDIAKKLLKANLGDMDIIADSAEPKSIDAIFGIAKDLQEKEYAEKGYTTIDLLNIRGARKGKDSINNGIDFLNEYKGIRIVSKEWHEFDREGVPKSGIAFESTAYVYKKDKNNKPLNEPIDYDNHGWDSTRYAREQYMHSSKKQVVSI